MALTIKDGAGSTTSLKTTVTGSDHMPHHIIQEISGANIASIVSKLTDISSSAAAVQSITASSTNPVYITGAVTISQPVNVDLVVGDTITASITGVASVSVQNPFFDHAMVAISHSYYTSVDPSSNYLGVKFPEEYRNVLGPYKSLYVTTTASSITIDNSGFAQMINYITASTDLSDSQYKIKVKITGSTEDSPQYVTGTLNTNLFGVNKYGLPSGGAALVVKVTGSNNSDPVFVSGSTDIGVAKYGFSEGAALVVKITGSSSDPVSVTGNFALDYASYALPTGSALVVKVTASAQDPLTVTGTLNVASISNPIYVSNVNSISGSVNVTSSKGNPLFVISDTDKPVYVANSASNALYITSSDSFPLQVQKRSATITQTQRYVANVYGFDWTVNSGTFVMATPDTDRKSLIIANPSSHELYIAIGSSSDPGFVNGFLLQTTESAPETYAFVIYPSGTYTADEYAASLFHAGFYISQSVNNQKTLVTRIGY